MERRRRSARISRAREPQSVRLARRKRWYFALMGTCITLVVLAWFVVSNFSVPAAVVMSMIAAPIPPVAVIVANWGEDH